MKRNWESDGDMLRVIVSCFIYTKINAKEGWGFVPRIYLQTIQITADHNGFFKLSSVFCLVFMKIVNFCKDVIRIRLASRDNGRILEFISPVPRVKLSVYKCFQPGPSE